MAGDPVIDVLGLGAVAIDELLYVDSYPDADAKVHLRDRQLHHGGQTGTALVAAARLGARAAYAGALGTDGPSEKALEGMRREGIDVSRCRRVAGLSPILSTVIVGDNGRTRAIFADTRNFRGADPEWPSDDVIGSAAVLFVDHWGVAGMIRAAEMARRKGVAVVADFERNASPRFGELLPLADHLILGRAFASQLSGDAEPRSAARRLLDGGHAVVVVTDGACGCWAMARGEDEAFHVPAFEVRVRDTTGCGDVFHGAYAAALALGEPLGRRLRIASASAALKAEKPGGQDGIPDRAAIDALLARRPR